MARNLIDGQKAGSGSPRQPVIAPDSASSITKLKMAVGLSEGEIEGFGRADIKLDGTPLSSLSSDIICDYRFGTNNQEYINGIDEVANEIGVGVELSTDWVKLITNSDIDHIGIRLRWGPLQTSHTNGDVSGVSITYEIHIAAVGGQYERVLATTLSDKTSDSYERYHEFKLPESDSGWMVKVVRVTPSSQSSLISDKMYVQAYSEIIKSKFTFPHTSLVYLEYNAKTFSNVAKLAVNAKGLIIKVPSNYDPVTRQYAGLWTGTFKMAYSNNPAWIYYDLVTNSRYGCGDRIDSSMVDKWSLYRLAQYCDQMVDDGYGGLEPRFTCNVYLQSKERAYDILNRLTGLFRAINFWNGSQLVVDADIPQDTSYLYTNANVVDGLFEYSGTAATDQYSAAKVAWDNPANGYNTEYEAVSYEHLVKKLGFKVLELDAWGCTSRGQALRAGRWALLAESDTVTFKVGMDGYLAMPGKIIEIQDEFYAGKSNGGRVISVSASRLEVTLDRPVETIAGDTISFNTTAGNIKKYNIVSSSGSVVTLSESADASVERMHIWAISSSQLATQKYRILTVKYDGVGEFTISAVEYNASKYEDIDSNILFDEPPTSIINPVVQAAVQNVVIDSYEFVYQGLNTVNLNIKWERAVNAVEYLVEIKKDNGSWLKLPATGNNSIELENIFAGSYIARVTAVSAFELKSLPTYSIKTAVQGKLTAPQAPLNPRVVPVLFGIEFYWDFPANSADIAVSRIAISYEDPTQLADESSFVTYDKAYSDNKLVLQHLDLQTRVWFKVKLIDKLGFESPYTAWVNGQPSQDFDKVLDLVSGHIGESTLDQILKGKIDGALGLAGEANSLASQANAAAANAQNAANQASTKAQEAANAAAQEAINRAAALQDGITQVTTDYRAEDAVVLGELVAYKASNDSAMATVVQKAESAVAAGSTNSQAITELTGQVQAINDTKLDASVISNYYTKGQAEDKSAEIAAGKIESYDANLIIGGVNLIPNSFDVPQFSNDGTQWSLYVDVVDGVRRICRIGGAQPSIMSNYTGEFINLPVGTVYTLSVKVRPIGSDYLLGFYGDDNSIKLCKADQWTTIQDTRTVINQPERVAALISYAVQQGIWIEVKEWQAEIGNKATSWSPSPADVQGAIDTNANAIQTVNAEVARVNGELFATAESVSNLRSNVGLLQGSINEVRQTVTNNQESTNTLVTSLRSGMADADDVSMMMRNATVVFEDLNFRDGYNGIAIYNNYGNGALVANFTDKLPDNPVASTRQLQFIHSGGATTPGLGGYHQLVQSRANSVFLIKFVAKLPEGFSFELHSNPYGDGANGYFIGSSEGTGKFKTYYAVYRCGATGYFSTVGFVAVNGPHPTPENPLIWYLASSTMYDCLDSKVTPDSVVNGIAEAKSTASTAVSKAEASAVLAQNLQTALDDTNAKLSTEYYTISQANDAMSGNINTYDASLVIGGVNTYDNETTPIEGLVGSPIVEQRNSGENVNGFFLIGDSTQQSAIRLRGVITEKGWWTISFYIKGNQGTPVGFTIDIADAPDFVVRSTADNNWTYIEYSSYVSNFDGTFNFIDFSKITWTYIFLKNIKVERGRKATAWTPSNQHVLGSLSANAIAIQNTNATVQNIDGRVTANSNSLLQLTSRVDNKADASVLTQYYTRAEADSAIAGKVEEFSSTIAVGGANLWSVVRATPVSEHGSHSVRVIREDEEEVWITVESLTNGVSLIRFDSCLVDQNTPFIEGEDVVLSFEVGSSGYYRLGTVYAYVGNVGSAIFNANLILDPRIWQRVVHKFKASAGNGVNGPSQLFGFYLAEADGWTVGTTLSIRHVQLQRGNTATAFSKAPALARATIKETTQTVNGIQAIKTVTIDNNGVMSGYGLISELKNGQVTSAFGVNANTFYIGSPSLDKKPFVQRNEWSLINGVWVAPGTYIDTAYIGAATIGTAHINDLAVTTAKIGEGQITTAKIGDLQVDTIKIKDNAVTSLLEAQRTQQRVEKNFPYIPANTLTSIKIKVVLMSGLSKNNRYVVYWRGVIGAGMSTRLSNTPQYLGWARKRVYFGSTSSTNIVDSRILVETNQLNGNYIKWYDNNAASTGNVTQWNVAEGIVDETGSLCLWVDVEWKSFADNIPADTFYGYLLTSDLTVLISEFKK